MKNITRHTGKLIVVKQIKCSSYGNPNFECIVDNVKFKTQNDSAYNYDIKNLEGKNVEVTVGTHYGKATLNTIEKL